MVTQIAVLANRLKVFRQKRENFLVEVWKNCFLTEKTSHQNVLLTGRMKFRQRVKNFRQQLKNCLQKVPNLEQKTYKKHFPETNPLLRKNQSWQLYRKLCQKSEKKVLPTGKEFSLKE